MANDLIPISDEQAKLGTKALDVLQGFGGFLREMLGTVPEDLVGLLGGDQLKVRRAVNMAETLAKARDRLRQSGVSEPQQVSLSLALPLLRAAADESRAQLQDMFARLLAAAMDPKKADLVRRSFITAVQEFDPFDARLLEWLSVNGHAAWQDPVSSMASLLKADAYEVVISLNNLRRLGCIPPEGEAANAAPLTPFGAKLLRACYG
jgi:hypothetical protein